MTYGIRAVLLVVNRRTQKSVVFTKSAVFILNFTHGIRMRVRPLLLLLFIVPAMFLPNLFGAAAVNDVPKKSFECAEQ